MSARGSRPSVVAEIERAAHLAGVYVERAASEVGVTQAEAHIVAELRRAGTSTVGALHHSFGHKRSTLTSVLDRLEARGHIARTTNPDDRRSLLVSLTPSGAAAAAVVASTLDELEQRLLKRVGARRIDEFHRVAAALERELRR